MAGPPGDERPQQPAPGSGGGSVPHALVARLHSGGLDREQARDLRARIRADPEALRYLGELELRAPGAEASSEGSPGTVTGEPDTGPITVPRWVPDAGRAGGGSTTPRSVDGRFSMVAQRLDRRGWIPAVRGRLDRSSPGGPPTRLAVGVLVGAMLAVLALLLSVAVAVSDPPPGRRTPMTPIPAVSTDELRSLYPEVTRYRDFGFLGATEEEASPCMPLLMDVLGARPVVVNGAFGVLVAYWSEYYRPDTVFLRVYRMSICGLGDYKNFIVEVEIPK